MSISITHPEIHKELLSADDYKPGPFAKRLYRRACLKQHPLLKRGMSIERHPSCQLQAERLEAVRAAGTGKRERLQDWQGIFHKIKTLRTGFEDVFVMRPMAATSLQLAYVAAGRLDAYLETGDDAADWLAGALLILEAGGTVTDLRNERIGWSGEGVLGTNAKLHRELIATIARVNAAES